MNRLLLLSCSQSKRTVPNLIPAIERYDGPAFRVVRRYLRDSVAKPRIYILSGEFGLIRHNESIPYYDRRMTPERALELGPIVATKLYMLIESEVDKHWETFICMSKSYLNALNASDSVLKTASRITVAEGSPGKKLTELYAWLYGEASTSLYKEPLIAPQDYAYLRGNRVSLTPEQIFDKARNSLANGYGNSSNYHSWYVLIDEQPVAPKWLVNQLTGLPPRDFTTSEARRFLSQLGIEVKHL